MIAKPSIGELLSKTDNSRYSLVIVVSKRARQLSSGSQALTDFKAESKVTIAAHELAEGKLEIAQ